MSAACRSLGPGAILGGAVPWGVLHGVTGRHKTTQDVTSQELRLQPLDGSGAPSPPGHDIQKWLPGGKHLPVENHGSRERLQIKTKYWGLLINVPEDSPHIKKKILDRHIHSLPL